ncbi:MAG TPA: hypothetical protein VJ827_02170 [Rubrobacter sp.]|nr:hypothetical protein [Rubrobacter sp.]
MRLSDLAAAVGKGLFAGAAGTAAMTISSTLEMKIRGRPASNAPAEAAAKVLGVEPRGEEQQARFSNLVHWGYGTGWGAFRGIVGAAGLEGPGATAAHFGAVWGSEQVMLPALGVAPPFWKWGTKEVAIDTLHHLVYAGATSLAYAYLDRPVDRR